MCLDEGVCLCLNYCFLLYTYGWFSRCAVSGVVEGACMMSW